MPVLLLLLALAVAFVLDCIIAWAARAIAPYTGLPVLDGLDFWNWFFILFLVWLVMLPVSLGSKSS